MTGVCSEAFRIEVYFVANFKREDLEDGRPFRLREDFLVSHDRGYSTKRRDFNFIKKNMAPFEEEQVWNAVHCLFPSQEAKQFESPATIRESTSLPCTYVHGHEVGRLRAYYECEVELMSWLPASPLLRPYTVAQINLLASDYNKKQRPP
uniref:Uncharacterized protein n=1 Tax=Vespula pensylvanica TaxID=30213 RepID=A0A834PBN9_VESPE|nr:hypothetical protein H0235_003343 [Vespula pensylvanica]